MEPRGLRRRPPVCSPRMSRFRLLVDGFYPGARDLRATFDARFADPRSTRGDRFVWDWWHLPDQYTHLRTPAWTYFPRKQYRAFHEALVAWGRRTLGCWDISPPWLSCYVEGCEQRLHSDVPHGPWAFVYSLTPPRPRFSGGETLILRPETLSYWPTFPDRPERELASLVDRIPSRFDRLLAFDPRFPHGVTRVGGTHDPREGRLVVHGWFTEPKPFATGALTAKQLDRPLDGAVGEVVAALADRALHGVLSVRLDIARTGEVERARLLADTLVDLQAPDAPPKDVTRAALRALRRARFPRARGATEVTLPLLFR
jgi:hypothetical protein